MECWKKLKTSNVFSSFIVCKNQSAFELFSNNSLFVRHVYKEKSPALHTRDLIFFTPDLQTVNNYSTIHC